jgi:hypothetical protein
MGVEFIARDGMDALTQAVKLLIFLAEFYMLSNI